MNFIFGFLTLDIGNCANSFALFKIPRIKEILGKSLTSTFEQKTMDLSLIPYNDANKGYQKAEVNEKRKLKLEEKLKLRDEDRLA